MAQDEMPNSLDIAACTRLTGGGKVSSSGCGPCGYCAMPSSIMAGVAHLVLGDGPTDLAGAPEYQEFKVPAFLMQDGTSSSVSSPGNY